MACKSCAERRAMLNQARIQATSGQFRKAGASVAAVGRSTVASATQNLARLKARRIGR